MAFVSDSLNETYKAAPGVPAELLSKYRINSDGSEKITAYMAAKNAYARHKHQAMVCWTPRLQVECLCAERIWFLTLTFDPERGITLKDEDGNAVHHGFYDKKKKRWNVRACRKEVSRYWKRVRSRLLKGLNRLRAKSALEPLRQKHLPKIRYFTAWEYGDQGVLHAHCLVFCKQSLKYAHLHSPWKAGISQHKLVKHKISAVGYVAPYVNKGADLKFGRRMASKSPSIGYVTAPIAVETLRKREFSYPDTYARWVDWRAKKTGQVPDFSPVESDATRLERIDSGWAPTVAPKSYRATTNRTGIKNKPDGQWHREYPPQYYRFDRQNTDKDGQSRRLKPGQKRPAEYLTRANRYAEQLPVRPEGTASVTDAPLYTSSDMSVQQKDFLRHLGRKPTTDRALFSHQRLHDLEGRRQQKAADAAARKLEIEGAQKEEAKRAMWRARNDRLALKSRITSADWSFKVPITGESPDEPPF